MSEKEQDRIWSVMVRDRDKHYCRYALPGCKGRGNEASHIFGRGYRKLRHDIDNGLAACRSCHTWVETHPSQAEELTKSILGETKWRELTAKLEQHYGIKNKGD